jgi:hypothetical protein
VFPRPKFAFLRPALLLGAGFLVLVAVAWAIGWRRPLSPGAVISSHGSVETSCQACHATGHVANMRCQRCHDPATAGRLDNRSHVLFGSRDVKKAAAAPTLECATCHVEHRGRTAPLTRVDQRQCSSCHFRSFKAHPEFAVLREPTRELPGLKFGHGPATAAFKGHVAEVMEKKGVDQTQACLFCHETGAGRDFQPIAFDRHCKECHEKALVATVGIPEADVLTPEVFIGGGFGTQPVTAAEFETGRGRVAKNTVRHRDDWVMASLRRLRRELEPEAHAAERAALRARLSRLRRRSALSTPLAQLDLEELAAREKMLQTELAALERRLQSLGQANAAGAAARVQEVATALAAAGDEAVKAEAAHLKTATASSGGSPEEFDARRKQVLALLDAVEAADPALKPRTDDLRRRLVALVQGDSTEEVLSRARDQRQAELARIGDERTLRASGALPPPSALLLGEQRALQTAMAEVETQLKTLDEGPPVTSRLGEEERARKKESLDSLLSSCVKCHVTSSAALTRVRAAHPVMVRARFMHQPHLQVATDCNRCHAGIEASKVASDLNFKGVQSCQECHSAGSARQDCLSCHRYHPPAVP